MILFGGLMTIKSKKIVWVKDAKNVKFCIIVL
jgi:hypothetical protein